MDATNKRPRDGEVELPEDAKRLRADLLLFDVLDADDNGAAGDDVASVIRSLEEEIGLSPPASPSPPVQPDLGYLLEASDDELGLPPPATADATAPSPPVEVVESGGYGQMWGFGDEEVFGYGGGMMGYGIPDGVMLDCGYYPDELFLPSDLYDSSSWRTESLPSAF